MAVLHAICHTACSVVRWASVSVSLKPQTSESFSRYRDASKARTLPIPSLRASLTPYTVATAHKRRHLSTRPSIPASVTVFWHRATNSLRLLLWRGSGIPRHGCGSLGVKLLLRHGGR